MAMMPMEVIFAIVLVDLPVDVDDKSGVKVRQSLGDSWWFLACESDDHYFEIVQEVVGVCSFQQVRELCFMKGGTSSNGGTVISRATPKCRFLLTQALRFVGRFEFVGSSALYTDSSIGLKEFDALDFGGATSNANEGRRVILKCYSLEESFQREVRVLIMHTVRLLIDLKYVYSHLFVCLNTFRLQFYAMFNWITLTWKRF